MILMWSLQPVYVLVHDDVLGHHFGPSGVRALPLAPGINVGDHDFRYFWSERSACAALGYGINVCGHYFRYWSERSACAALGCWHTRRWPL